MRPRPQHRLGGPAIHDLRHTSAGLALAAGLPIKVVSHRLGHSTTAVTADLCTHVVPELARGAAEQMANCQAPGLVEARLPGT